MIDMFIGALLALAAWDGIKLLSQRLVRRKGYWVCPMDWQGPTSGYGDCTWVAGEPPVTGVSVYYQSPSGPKPFEVR